MQIFLSEVLGVPASVETSAPGVDFNFYDNKTAFDYPTKAYDYEALRSAVEVGDCRNIDNNSGDNSYRSCAHVLLEGM